MARPSRTAAAVAAVVASLLPACQAAVTMPRIFSDGLVLQCNVAYDQRPFFYGLAAPGELVQVNRTDSSYQTYATTADEETGEWIITLNAGCGAGPYTFVVAGSSDNFARVTTITNVTYGDVYLCSGQSNMAMSLKSTFDGAAYASKVYPNIRLFPVAESASYTPQPDVPAFNGSSTPCWWAQNPKPDNSSYACNVWQTAAPGISDEFSAACFYSAVALSEALGPGRTIGLVYAAVDGTPMQAWSPPEVIGKCNGTAEPPVPSASSSAASSPSPVTLNGVNPNDPSVLFNAMINPISRFAIRGVWWYQGESDSGDSSAKFTCLFSALIESWRRRWRTGDFAFVFVQLAPQDSVRWPQYYMFDARMGQAGVLPAPGINTTDTTGMAVAYDCGDMGSPYPPSHVHSRNKTLVGQRAAAAMLHVQYAWQYPAGGANLTNNVSWSGPVPVSVEPTAAAAAPAGLRGRATTYTVAFSTLDGLGIFSTDTAMCWSCCAGSQDTFQLSDPSGITWVNATFAPGADNTSVVLTPLGAPPSAGGFTQARYAPNLWPQCAIYASGNRIPVSPFQMNITVTSTTKQAPEEDKAAAFAAARAEVLRRRAELVPVAKRGPQTWTTWRGRAIPPAPEAVGGQPIVASTPPIGLNTWNGFHCNVDESIMRKIADVLTWTGLRDLGYDYVNIDDCWAVDRRPDGTIIEDPVRFPSGIRATADYIHGKGMRFGIYTAQHEYTCQLRPGSLYHETIDVQTYCKWTVDYIKLDGCQGASWPSLNTSWILFRDAIDTCQNQTGRQMVFSVESCGPNNDEDCQAWIPALANLWRTTGDIQATWASVLSNLDNNNELAAIAGPGHWNDADMLEVGNPGLTLPQQQAHFFAWCLIASPLLIGTDVVSGLDNATLALLSAPEILAVSQDPLGIQGVRVSQQNPAGPECWARPLADGSVAVLLLNRGEAPASVSCSWAEIGLPAGATADVRDLWLRKDLGPSSGSFSAQLEGTSAMIVKVKQQA